MRETVRKKKEKIKEQTYKIMKDKANILRETFTDLAAARKYIEELQAKDREYFLVCDYQII